MYGASGFAARRVYPWLTAFYPTSPFPRTPGWAYQPRTYPKPKPFYPAFYLGSVDPSVWTSLIQSGIEAGGAITTTAIQAKAAKKAAEAEERAAKREAKAAAQAASFQPSVQPATGISPMLAIGGMVFAAAAVYMIARKPS